MATAAAIGGVLLIGMLALAGYAAQTLPKGALVPLNAGMPEYSLWLPKLAGLAAWVAAGAVTFAAFAAVTVSLGANWAVSLRVVLLPGVMLVMLAAEAGAVIVARRRYADGGPAATAEAVAEDSLPSQPESATH